MVQVQQHLHDLKNTAQQLACRAALLKDAAIVANSLTMIKQVQAIASLMRMMEAERAIIDKDAG